MKVVTLTGSTSYSDQKVMTDAQKLMFRVNYKNGQITVPTATIEIKVGGNSERICRKISLDKLFEFAQNKEGFIRKYVTATRTIVTGYVDLAEFGAIPLNDSKYLSIELADCDVDCIFDIYVKSSNEIAKSFFEYNLNNTAEAVKSINIMTAGKEYLLLTKGNIDEVKLTYETGRNERLTNDELNTDGDDNNDLVSITQDTVTNTTTAQYGTNLLYILSLAKSNGEPNVVAVELNTTGSTLEYILVDSKAL